MGVQRVEDLTTFQFAIEFKTEVYRLLGESADAQRDFKYLDQLRGAVSDVEADIAEGFARRNPREFANFLRYAMASLAEANTRLQDGVARRYFSEPAVQMSLVWARRCKEALKGLHATQIRFAEQTPSTRTRPRRRRRKRRR
jgi:four helix bundle protein